MISFPQAAEGIEFGKPHPRNKLWNHVPTEHNLIIPKLSFILDSTHRTHAFNNEAIRFWCLLESLLATPLKVA